MPRPAHSRLGAVDATGVRTPVALANSPLGAGGDAAIHAVEGDPGRVAKVYHDPAAEPRRRAKLEAMLAVRPAGRDVRHAGQRLVQLAWPEQILEAVDGTPAGYLMTRLDAAAAPVLEALISARARRDAGLPGDLRFRVAVARDLAAAVAALHAVGHHVIDLKPVNVHVTRDGFVTLLDCDGFSVAGPDGARFPAHQYTDGYIAPEALRASLAPEALGEAQDRFALAVVLFRLLNSGLHPFQGVPRDGARVPTTNGERIAAGLYPYGRTTSGTAPLRPSPLSLHAAFDGVTRDRFDDAFAGSPDARPSAADWRDHLTDLLDDGLRPCPNDANHARFPNQPCGLCARKETLTTPVRSSSRSTSSRGRSRSRKGSASRSVSRTAVRPSRPTSLPLVSRARAALQAVVPPTGTPGRGQTILRTLSLAAAAGVALTATVFVAVTPSPETASWDQDLRLAVTQIVPDLEQARRALENGARPDGAPPASMGPTPVYAPLDAAVGFPGPREPAAPLASTLEVGLDASAPSLLFAAVGQADPDLVALLLAYGARPNVPDRWGRTPLMLATLGPDIHRRDTPLPLRTEEVRALLEAGGARAVHSDAIARETRQAGARLSSQLAPPTDDPVLAALAERGQVAPDEQAVTFETLGFPMAASPRSFPLGAWTDHAALLRVLLDAGASVEARDAWGRTALSYAAAYGNGVAVQALLDAGADPDAADIAGVTPLITVADQTARVADDTLAVTLARALLDGGADANARDAAGRRAVDFVAERRSTVAGKTVLSADPYAGTRRGRTIEPPTLDADASLEPPGLPAMPRGVRLFAQIEILLTRIGSPRQTLADIGDGATVVSEAPAGAPAPEAPVFEPLPWETPLEVTACGRPRDGEQPPRFARTVAVTIGRVEAFEVGRAVAVELSAWRFSGALADMLGVEPEASPLAGDLTGLSDRIVQSQRDEQARLEACEAEILAALNGPYDLRGVPDRWLVGTVELVLATEADTRATPDAAP